MCSSPLLGIARQIWIARQQFAMQFTFELASRSSSCCLLFNFSSASFIRQLSWWYKSVVKEDCNFSNFGTEAFLVSCYTGSPCSKYEHRRASALLGNIQNIRICMGKKPIVSVTYENERISIKNSLPYLKCVLRPSCVVHGPIYGQGGQIVISFLFFTSPFLSFTFWFSLRHLAFRLRFRFLFFTFPFSFSTFWFALLHFAFRLWFRLWFFLLFRFFSYLFIFTDQFRFTFQFLFLLLNYRMKTKTNIKKNENQNRQSSPSCFAGRSIWRIKVSIRRSAALLTMLAQVNFLILPPLIALNHNCIYFQRTF